MTNQCLAYPVRRRSLLSKITRLTLISKFVLKMVKYQIVYRKSEKQLEDVNFLLLLKFIEKFIPYYVSHSTYLCVNGRYLFYIRSVSTSIFITFSCQYYYRFKYSVPPEKANIKLKYRSIEGLGIMRAQLIGSNHLGSYSRHFFCFLY